MYICLRPIVKVNKMPVKYQPVFVLAVITLLQACAMAGFFQISEPSVSEDQNVKMSSNRVLLLPDLSVSIKPQNYEVKVLMLGIIIPIIPIPDFGPSRFSSRPFTVSIQFDSGSKEFLFDPDKVNLRYKGEEFRPTKVYGPHKGGAWPLEAEKVIPGHPWVCRNSLPTKSAGDLKVTQFSGKVCYTLQFPIDTISLKQNFSILISGVEKDGKNFPIPAFTFNSSTRFGGYTLMVQ